jgi:hypothetical protein
MFGGHIFTRNNRKIFDGFFVQFGRMEEGTRISKRVEWKPPFPTSNLLLGEAMHLPIYIRILTLNPYQIHIRIFVSMLSIMFLINHLHIASHALG